MSLIKSIAFILSLLTAGLAHAAPEIQHWTTDQGTRVYYIHAPGLPIVDVQVVFDAGSARDGKQSGLASITNHMLAQGAAGMNATEIAERFESVGAQFSTDLDRDKAWLTLRSLSQSKWLDPAIDTLAKIVSQPDFSQPDFERERKRYLISLKQAKQDPGSVAKRAFYKAIFRDHPYASMPEGTESSLQALQPSDLKAFFKRHYVRRNALVAVVGDLDRVAADKLVARIMHKVPEGKAASKLPEVKPLQESQIIRIAHPSSQSHILMGHPGNYRGDPDYYTMYLGNHALGGSGLVSRLSNEIREKRGLSYSVYSYFLPLARKGLFQMGMQTKNNQVEEGLKVMRQTVQDYVEKGMTAEELEDSRKNITGGFPLRIDSNKKLLGYITMIGFYGLPLTYLNDFNGHIESITLEQIHETLRRRLHPDKMVTVIVGGKGN